KGGRTDVSEGFVNASRVSLDPTDEQNLILKQVDAVCKELRPIEDRCYLEHRFNDAVGGLFGRAHLLGLPISRRYGDGQGVDMVTYALAIERIGREGTGVRTFFSGHTSLGMLTVQRWGTNSRRNASSLRGRRARPSSRSASPSPRRGATPAP